MPETLARTAERHGATGVISAVIGRSAAATGTMRVGAGGITRPKHVPPAIAGNSDGWNGIVATLDAGTRLGREPSATASKARRSPLRSPSTAVEGGGAIRRRQAERV